MSTVSILGTSARCIRPYPIRHGRHRIPCGTVSSRWPTAGWSFLPWVNQKLEGWGPGCLVERSKGTHGTAQHSTPQRLFARCRCAAGCTTDNAHVSCCHCGTPVHGMAGARCMLRIGRRPSRAAWSAIMHHQCCKPLVGKNARGMRVLHVHTAAHTHPHALIFSCARHNWCMQCGRARAWKS